MEHESPIHVVPSNTHPPSSLVLSMPHSGDTLDDQIEHLLNLGDSEVVRTLYAGIDTCVPDVTGMREYASATRVWTTLPRAIIDPNRLLTQINQYAVEGESGEGNSSGLIWTATMGESVDVARDMLVRPYTRSEFEQLVAVGHKPFENAVKQAMDQAHKAHGIAIQFDLHSMPGRIPSYIPDGRHKGAYVFAKDAVRGEGKGQMADLYLVEIGAETASPLIRETLLDVFRGHGLIVGQFPMSPVKDSPYSRYADPARQRYSLAVEIVGHNFEPKRMAGDLTLNREQMPKFRAAFYDAFRALEQIRPH
ncbi:MAG: N-formylglutamate amidohydrolase [Nanoarchaeota archaeon]|nr:N-formylglutamate amidohydrolase [Nanoarchaeota archaeon]